MSVPTVFISYSHDSPEHNDLVLKFSDALRSHGVDAELDRYHVRPPKGWPHWCEEQVRPEKSDFVLMICTETYLKRVQDKVPADEGRGVFWEGGLIYDYIYDAKGNTRFIPILFSDASTDFIPPPIRNHTRYRVGTFDLTDPGYQELYRELTGQPLVTKPPLGEVIKLGHALAVAATPLAVRSALTDFRSIENTNFKADISRIDKYAPAELIGRESELALLDDAWNKVVAGEKTRPRVLTFVALGGEGKTSLLAKWAAQLAHEDWPGCEAAFAWSFYSQGTREQMAASSDLFLKEALTFFGDKADKEFAASNAGAYEKGQRLARVVGQRRNLLILDGLEPLQYPTEAKAFKPGELKDQGVAKLLKDLASSSHGLCIVTTRIEVPDLQVFKGGPVIETQLRRLPRAAGVALLKSLGVKGSERRNLPLKDGDEKSEKVNEFEKLVEDVKGHALTLTLLGGFLKRAFHGDIRQRDRVKFEEADEKIDGGHAFRTMTAYEQWLLRDGGEEGRREVAVLRLMGLFDRPADAGCLAALRSETIPGLTESLTGLGEDDWEYCLTGLEAAKLLTVNRDESGAIVSLDAHPHLREYFARQLRTQQPDVWRTAHRRLYRHLCENTKEGEQPTLEELQPLYQAVAHGCQAGLQQEALNEVYITRILRGHEIYSGHKLGAIASDLGAIACFFEIPWRRLSTLLKARHATVLNEAAFNLRALGRLTESLEPMRAGLEQLVTREDWNGAARMASNLSEVELMMGDVAGAVGDAHQSVVYADLSGDAFARMAFRTTHADALHQAGRRAEALKSFREAEQMQIERQPDYPLLYSVQGFQYCDLLLTAPECPAWRQTLKLGARNQEPKWINACGAVTERAAKTLDWVTGRLGLLDEALDHLTLGRAALYATILQHADFQRLTSDLSYIDAGVAGLRRSGDQIWITTGLLTRAWLRFLRAARDGPESAQEDLDEAWRLPSAGRCVCTWRIFISIARGCFMR